MQAAHIMPKGQYPSVRHDIDNILALCASCHIYGPDAWHKGFGIAWATEHLGQEWMDRLRLKALATKTTDREALRIYLEAELDRLQIPRPAGRPSRSA